MKQLLLIRHSKSSWDDPSIAELDRPLNNRGKREAKMLGQFLIKKALLPQLIISSPARRARSTAKEIARDLGYQKENIEISDLVYSDNISDLLSLVQSLSKSIDQVFIVGHNPSLLEFGNYLSCGNIEKLPTSGVVLIDFKIKFWKDVSNGSGNIVFVDKAR